MTTHDTLPPSSRAKFYRRLAIGCVVIVTLTSGGLAAAALLTVRQVAADFAAGGKRIVSPELTVAEAGAPQTILIIGDDHIGPTTTYSTGGSDNVDGVHLLHADTFMLVRMDAAEGQTSILSIPRDLLVNFTYDGQDYPDQKFNSSYSIGQANLVLKVAKATLPGITINHVIDFNFASFLGLVNAIGCVYIDVDQRYYNAGGDGYLPIDLEPGYQRLCGENALSYVRYRHTDSDFVRVARQADFIRQAKAQLGTSGLLSRPVRHPRDAARLPRREPEDDALERRRRRRPGRWLPPRAVHPDLRATRPGHDVGGGQVRRRADRPGGAVPHLPAGGRDRPGDPQRLPRLRRSRQGRAPPSRPPDRLAAERTRCWRTSRTPRCSRSPSRRDPWAETAAASGRGSALPSRAWLTGRFDGDPLE